MKYLLCIESAPGSNCSAYFPDVPGCVTVGDTVQETIENAAEALSLHLDNADALPEPRTFEAILAEEEFAPGDVFAVVEYKSGLVAA